MIFFFFLGLYIQSWRIQILKWDISGAFHYANMSLPRILAPCSVGVRDARTEESKLSN